MTLASIVSAALALEGALGALLSLCSLFAVGMAIDFYRNVVDATGRHPVHGLVSKYRPWGNPSQFGTPEGLRFVRAHRMMTNLLRGVRFPGILRPGLPWKGSIAFPAKADIPEAPNAPYIEIDDTNGLLTPVAFELDKDGDGVTPGRVQVDLSAAVTAADVAAAFMARLNEVRDDPTIAGRAPGEAFSMSAVRRVAEVVTLVAYADPVVRFAVGELSGVVVITTPGGPIAGFATTTFRDGTDAQHGVLAAPAINHWLIPFGYPTNPVVEEEIPQ